MRVRAEVELAAAAVADVRVELGCREVGVAEHLLDAEENPAVRRLAVMSLKNGSPQRDTIVILESLAGDDEADRELRAAAKRVAELLKKKGR